MKGETQFAPNQQVEALDPLPEVNLLPLDEFVELIKATDEDAEHRLQLVEQATPVLYQAATITNEDAEKLAEKFERWRYQRLNKYSPRLSANERGLSDVLDLAAVKILRVQPRPPKNPRAAIYSGSGSQTQLKSALRSSGFPGVEAALDTDVNVAAVVRAAAEVTWRHFRVEQSPGIQQMAPAVETGALPRRWRMLLYAPLYLSNYCVNHCLYCAFRYPNKLDRLHLSVDEVIAEAELLRTQGHEHLLVVAGDFPKLTSTDYLVTMIRELVARKFSIAVEVAAQSTTSYAQMVRAGACAVTLYQETYQEELYRRLHPRGPKLWFDWRLEAPERAAEAGMKRLGLGILLGLADPLRDLRCLIRHGQYLQERFPEVRLAFSLPRIHEAPESFKSGVAVDDETFVRLYCALRFSFPAADLVLSTREPASLRDRLAEVCITQMSAGSCTAPGGYSEIADGEACGEQFPVFDQRTTAQVADSLKRSGFDLCWSVPGR